MRAAYPSPFTASAGIIYEEAPKQTCAEPRRAAQARSKKMHHDMQSSTKGYVVDLCTLVATIIIFSAINDTSWVHEE